MFFKPQGHKLRWKTLQEYQVNHANIIIEHEKTGKPLNKLGMNHDSVVSNMSFEVDDLMCVVPPVMHTRDGLGLYLIKLIFKHVALVQG